MASVKGHGRGGAILGCTQDNPQDKVHVLCNEAWDIDVERQFAN